MTSHRLILTVTDLDDPYTQVWTLRDKPEVWDFLNAHAQMNSGITPKYKDPTEVPEVWVDGEWIKPTKWRQMDDGTLRWEKRDAHGHILSGYAEGDHFRFPSKLRVVEVFYNGRWIKPEEYEEMGDSLLWYDYDDREHVAKPSEFRYVQP